MAITMTDRVMQVQFTGGTLDELSEAVMRVQENVHWDLFKITDASTDDGPRVIATYTNPNIPWVSPNEARTIDVVDETGDFLGG